MTVAVHSSNPIRYTAAIILAAQRFGLRRLRLTTGLILFIYVASHLTNHALGNVSLNWMERGLRVQKWIWQSLPGAIALYTALTIHFSLGIWALYKRRHYGWKAADIVQLVLGLAIPLLLAHHLAVTRIDLAIYGTAKGYSQELYSFWVASPLWGIVQVLLLIVAWIHGCLGVYFWLRLKPFYPTYAPLLLAAASLLPVLALLGFLQGGRTVLALANDPAWRAANLAPDQTGTPTQNAVLDDGFRWFLFAFGAAVALAIAARGFRTFRERTRPLIRLHYPDGRVAQVPRGFSVLEGSLSAGIPHAWICGGRARCSTCRIRIVGGRQEVPPPGEVESAILARVQAGPSVRLACQLRPLGDLSVVPLVPADVSAEELRRRAFARGGQERFIVVLVADMRGSTEFAVRHLPFDVVFTLGSFVEALGRGIAEAGGYPNQFIGDGLLAMFGVDCGPTEACRRALRAAVKIADNVSELNELMAAEWGEPVRFGIGIHGGEAIVGEIGYRDNMVFTALGDPANLASRLQDQCKVFECELVMSEDVCRISEWPLHDLPRNSIALRGRADPMAVCTVPRASDLALIVGSTRVRRDRTDSDPKL
ncbi:MAG: adenylate/guanylate cyclase domain-containing protein [Bradyrhizobiaceae bacterium]|nr:adenylate/guanylate cyclase domain-containing protein [Bradyrhizobiaceae bacterium]